MSEAARGFKPVKKQFWGISAGAASTDADSECLYEEISGPSAEDSASSACADSAQAAAAAQAQQRSVRRTRKLEQHAPRPKADHHHHQQPRHRPHSQQHALRPSNALQQQQQQPQGVAAAGQSAGGGGIGSGGIESRQSQASSFKLTRGRFSAARYLQTTTTTTTTTHYQQPTSASGFPSVNLPAPPYHSASRLHRHGVRPTTRHHFGLRGSFSNETQEEVPEEDEATLRELLIRSALAARPLLPIDIT